MMDAVTIASDIPLRPPKHFEYKEEPRRYDAWRSNPQIIENAAINSGFADWSSSSPCVISEIWFVTWLESFGLTVSKTNRFKHVTDLLFAKERAAAVRVSDALENLFELRRLTGFTWSRLAHLLNVDRRTLNNWAKGGKMRDWNRVHIAKTLEVLRFADRGDAELNAAVLDEHRRSYELSPFEAIRLKNYETAKQSMSYGHSKPLSQYAATDTAFWFGEFQQMVIHPDADGTETIDPLPDEPMPVYRKRKIKRG